MTRGLGLDFPCGDCTWSARSDGARAPHFAAKAKQVVHLFMNGGPSHLDTFDPKPMLKKYHGKTLPGPTLRTERKTGAALGFALPVQEIWRERHRGQRAICADCPQARR